MTTTLKLVVICETLGAMKSFQGICFGHAFFKACQYTIKKKKKQTDLKYVLSNLPKKICRHV
jgi:hypothetical protein